VNTNRNDMTDGGAAPVVNTNAVRGGFLGSGSKGGPNAFGENKAATSNPLSPLAFISKLNFGWRKKLPVILQTETAECGLAALAMVAAYHGHKVDLALLRQRYSVSKQGATLKQIIDIASHMGFSSRPLRLDLHELIELKTPCILHWELNHFVVLKQVLKDGSSIVIHDPALGERRINAKDVSDKFTGVALELHPSAKFEKKVEEQSISIAQLMGNVTGLKRSLVQILALSLALEVFAVLSPFFSQWVVDGAIVSGDKDLLSLLAIGFGLVMLIQIAVSSARSWAVMYMASHLNVQWLGNVFGHLMRLPIVYFEKRHLGDIVSRFHSVQTIQQTLTTSFVEGMLDGLMAITMIVIMFVYSATLTWVVLASLAVYAAIRWLAYGPMRRITEEQIALGAVEQSLFLESIRAVQTIKLFCAEDNRRARWMNALVESMNRGIQTQKRNMGFGVANQLLCGIENIAIMWLGALLVMDNKLSIGMLFAFVSYKTTFSGRVYSLIGKFVELKMLKLQAQRLADIVLTAPEQLSPHETGGHAAQSKSSFDMAPAVKSGQAPTPEIELKGVSFRYSDSDPWVLKDINLQIARGESLAITGPSGCGKSTLLKIILGLIEPTQGDVLFRGNPIKKLGTAYRRRVAAVMQDDQLLSGSIGENIRFFAEQKDDERLLQCAMDASIARDVARMPMQFETLVGDMGSSLSGGQKQRLIIARALYANPDVLLMDEATSDLDETNEAAITATLNARRMTRILVTHRLGPLAACDCIFDAGSGWQNGLKTSQI
jgi:ATP-binding cassette, subfamily B, bacterial CvaB/MchF/RaxB